MCAGKGHVLMHAGMGPLAIPTVSSFADVSEYSLHVVDSQAFLGYVMPLPFVGSFCISGCGGRLGTSQVRPRDVAAFVHTGSYLFLF